MFGRDERGNVQAISGYFTEVHNPLGSAADFARGHDSYIWEEGGVLMPKNGPIAKGLQAAFNLSLIHI
eukprot:2051516-Prorocentrum_lima.AAC.1